MKMTTTQILKACSLTMLLLGSTAFIAAISLPDVAHADSGKGNGNGGGNGNAGGNGNGNGGGNGNGNGNSEKAVDSTDTSGNVDLSTTKVAKTKKPKAKSLAEELGVSPSELGALNAAHASPNALKHASPNSRVGRIAAYKTAVLEGVELQAELDAKKAALDALTPPTRSVEAINADVAAAAVDLGVKTAAVAKLEADLALAGGTNAQIEADLAAARVALTAATVAANTLQAEQTAAIEYETLSTEVGSLTQQVADQPALERSLLEAAANKPVTDAVEAAVKVLLGL